jgi:hypothetical protein
LTLRDIDEMMKKKYDITLGEMSPDEYLNDCKVPVFFSQTKNDEMTEPSDIQSIYAKFHGQKTLFWIQGEKKPRAMNAPGTYDNRFDGYNYWQENPERMLNWIGKFIK